MSENEEPTVATTEDPQADFPEKFEQAKKPAAKKPAAKKAESDEQPDPKKWPTTDVEERWSAGHGNVLEERTVTVHKPYHYKQLAADLGFDRDWRELAALNKVRNGRYDIEPGTVITVTPNRLPLPLD